MKPRKPYPFIAAAAIMLGGLSAAGAAAGLESLHFGFDPASPRITDSLRLSGRIGTAWWSGNKPRTNPENGGPLPYAYHDGYVESLGTKIGKLDGTLTARAAAERWRKIMKEGEDPLTGAKDIGRPGVIILDELTAVFADGASGGRAKLLAEALRIYVEELGGSRSDIIGLCSPGVSQAGDPGGRYSTVAAASRYMRALYLELYVSQLGWLTGSEPLSGGGMSRLGVSGDAYLARRLTAPVGRWLDAGVGQGKLRIMLAVSAFGEAGGATETWFFHFLNRQFWFLANGFVSADRKRTDGRIGAVLRAGVGSYTWAPGGKNVWRMAPLQVNRDKFFEKYLAWYCAGGNRNPHSDGVDPR